MFSGMGMFGAFGFDPEEETKKNEEMKREAELRKKYEENLDKPITITQRQLMEAQAHVMANGKFMRIAKERDPQMGAMLILFMTWGTGTDQEMRLILPLSPECYQVRSIKGCTSLTRDIMILIQKRLY